MSKYFPKPNYLGATVKVELDLPNYATKTDLKIQQELIHYLLLEKTDLANLKSDVDKLDIDELKNLPSNSNNLKSKVDKLEEAIPVGLSKLINVVNNDIVIKDAYNGKIKNQKY